MSEHSYSEIWATLSSVNVNDHTKQKNGLTYLSWAWAWGVMMEYYPDMQIEWHTKDGLEAIYYPGGTAMVGCTVTIGQCSRSMWLPVMDYKNKAIANPDSRDISDTKMRCLVKCFAMFGLGHYIYAGEDLPQEEGRNEREAEEIIAKINKLGFVAKAEGVGLSQDIIDIVKEAKDSRDIDMLKEAHKKLAHVVNITTKGD